MAHLLKSETEKFLIELEKFGGLNNVPKLYHHLKSIEGLKDSSFEVFYFDKKPELEIYLDNAFKAIKDSEVKEIDEVTGDADFSKNPSRQLLYQDLIKQYGVKMRMLMKIDGWTQQNAEILHSLGVEVAHTDENYHFGILANNLMFTLQRTPISSEVKKIIGESQKPEEVLYSMAVTSHSDVVKYASRKFDDLWKTGVPYEKAKINLEDFKNNHKLIARHFEQ
jgi:hypothetical protein